MVRSCAVLVDVAAGAVVVAGGCGPFPGISGIANGVSGGTAALGVAGFGNGPISRLKSFGRSDAFEPESITPSLFARGPDQDQLLFALIAMGDALGEQEAAKATPFCSGTQPTTMAWPGSTTKFTGKSRSVSSC